MFGFYKHSSITLASKVCLNLSCWKVWKMSPNTLLALFQFGRVVHSQRAAITSGPLASYIDHSGPERTFAVLHGSDCWLLALLLGRLCFRPHKKNSSLSRACWTQRIEVDSHFSKLRHDSSLPIYMLLRFFLIRSTSFFPICRRRADKKNEFCNRINGRLNSSQQKRPTSKEFCRISSRMICSACR